MIAVLCEWWIWFLLAPVVAVWFCWAKFGDRYSPGPPPPRTNAADPAKTRAGAEQHRVRRRRRRRKNKTTNVATFLGTAAPPRIVLVATFTPAQLLGARGQPVCSSCGVVAAKRGCQQNLCKTCCLASTASACTVHLHADERGARQIRLAASVCDTILDLSYGKLSSLPALGCLGGCITSLNLSNNQLSSLPADIGALINLEELFLQYNNVSCFLWLHDTGNQSAATAHPHVHPCSAAENIARVCGPIAQTSRTGLQK